MREELLEYYERELTYLRQMGGEFARKYPRVAGRLLLDPERCEDPTSIACWKASRSSPRGPSPHRRRFPRDQRSPHPRHPPRLPSPHPLADHRGVPARPGPGQKDRGHAHPARHAAGHQGHVEGLPCRFQTAYDVDLWPFSVAAAEWRQPERMQRPPRPSAAVQAVAAARLLLRCQRDVSFSGLPLSRLRFHLAGDASVVYTLYELLSEKCIEIQLRDPKDERKLIVLEPGRLRRSGFDAEESLLPFVAPLHGRAPAPAGVLRAPLRSFSSSTSKDLSLWPRPVSAMRPRSLPVFSFERAERQQVLELGVNERTFRLGCTPAINLFPQPCEPILLSQTRHDYTIVPIAGTPP